MIKAFVLVKCGTGFIHGVMDELNKINEVTEANAVTGEYDVIVELEANNMATVGDIVTSQIHGISGVEDTVTCITS